MLSLDIKNLLSLIEIYTGFGKNYHHEWNRDVRDNILILKKFQVALQDIVIFEDLITYLGRCEDKYHIFVDKDINDEWVPIILTYLIFCKIDEDEKTYTIDFRSDSGTLKVRRGSSRHKHYPALTYMTFAFQVEDNTSVIQFIVKE